MAEMTINNTAQRYLPRFISSTPHLFRNCAETMGLLNRTCYRRECTVSVAAYQSNRTHNKHQNHRQYDRVFGTLLIDPKIVKRLVHFCLLPNGARLERLA